MTTVPFTSGRIQALESRLLQRGQIERMVGASNAEEAFRVLTELQYAEFFDTETQAKDFERILRQGLWETKEMLQQGTDNDEALKLLWWQFDAINFKQAAAKVLLEDAADPKAAIFSTLGFWPYERVLELWEGKMVEDFSEDLVAFVASIKQQWEAGEISDFMEVEYAIDKTLFGGLQDMRTQFSRSFVLKVRTVQADLLNLRLFARYLFLRSHLTHEDLRKVLDSFWLPFGEITLSSLSGVTNKETFQHFLSSSPFSLSLSAEEEATFLLQLEKALDDYYLQFLQEHALSGDNPLAEFLYYFERRVRNARILQFIMFAKFGGLSEEKIFTLLKYL